MEVENEVFKFGSKELAKELEGNYMKFSKGIPVNIEVIMEQDIPKRVMEFEENGEKRVVTKYDLRISIDGEEKLWGVSKKVLTTINEHIGATTKFKVILRDTSYEVIPLGLSE